MKTARERYAAYLELEKLFDGLPPSTHWIGGTEACWFVAPRAGGMYLHIVDGESKQRHVALTALASSFAIGDYVVDAGGWPFDGVSVNGEAGFRVDRGTSFVEVFPSGDLGPLRQGPVGEGPTDKRFYNRQLFLAPHVAVPEVASHDGSRLASIRERNLVVRHKSSDTGTALTLEVDHDISWDLEAGAFSYGARAASSINPWSPNDTALFAARVDQSACRHMPTVDFTGKDVVVDKFTVVRSGEALPSVTAALFDDAAGKRVDIDLEAHGDAFICPVGWLADGTEFWLAKLSRDMQSIDHFAANSTTGKCRLVLSERSKTFVRIQHEVLYARNCGITLLPDPSRFLWQSERDGWNHLYLYDRTGTLLRKLTHGSLSVVDVKAVDAENDAVYFTARGTPERPYDIYLYRVGLAGGNTQRLTAGPGVHEVSISPTFGSFMDWYSTAAMPPVLRLHRITSDSDTELYSVDISELDAIGWRAPEEVVVKAGDGKTELWGVMYVPADFDPKVRYPVVENIYAGPQITFAPHSFGLGSTFKLANQAQALAQLGFVVVVLDGRGTPGRSKAFQDFGYGRFGQFEVAEHASALRQLSQSRPWMDLDRVGIFGHSWGGHFAVRALAEAGNLYKAAVASGSDLTGNNFLVEPYLGAPDTQAEAHAAFSTLPLAHRITGHLLLIAGTDEYPMLHDAMRMTQALIEAGVQHDLVILPGQSHSYRGASAAYVVEATARFLERHLGGPASAAARD